MKLSLLTVLLCASTVCGQNAARRAAASRNHRGHPVRVTENVAESTTASRPAEVEYAPTDDRNQWFQEFRLFQPPHVGPFRYTHPLIPRRTLVPGTNRWIWTDSASSFRAEQTRSGAGFSSRAGSHRWHW